MENQGNIGLSTIIERYAAALFELGEQKHQLEVFDRELFNIKNLLSSNEELNLFLENPVISIEDKKHVADDILKDKVSLNILNLVKLLLDKNRIFIFPYLADYYHNLLNKKNNIITANVITAIEIDEQTINKVKSQLEKLSGKKTEVKTKLDPEIIAGMIVEIDGKIIDGSLKSKLENMKQQII